MSPHSRLDAVSVTSQADVNPDAQATEERNHVIVQIRSQDLWLLTPALKGESVRMVRALANTEWRHTSYSRPVRGAYSETKDKRTVAGHHMVQLDLANLLLIDS